jgi:hypothetical protein
VTSQTPLGALSGLERPNLAIRLGQWQCILSIALANFDLKYPDPEVHPVKISLAFTLKRITLKLALIGKSMQKTVLILGSGPAVVQAKSWDQSAFDLILTVNNAWLVRPDWDILIYPDDFPIDRRPCALKSGQTIVTSTDYVPVQNMFGGFVYAGGTMAFTAAYWALGALKPAVIAMMGCDMTYDGAQTHFYGNGTADPLRKDISLRSLEAKSARLGIIAAQNNCAMVNMSTDPSRLTFQRTTPFAAAASLPVQHDATLAAAALDEEARLGYYVPSGKYWKQEDQFDPDAIDRVDQMWLKAARLA